MELQSSTRLLPARAFTARKVHAADHFVFPRRRQQRAFRHKMQRTSELESAARVGALPAVCSATSEQPSLQLATARLPGSVNQAQFVDSLYNWASTLTVSGKNLPFALPLKVLKRPAGFELSLLTIVNGEPSPVATIEASVEEEPGVGQVLFVRFREGPGAQADRRSPLPSEPQKRLKVIIDGLVDIPLIMNSMKTAIRQAVAAASPAQPPPPRK